jgi:predicted DNA-binding WGR domain protein
MAFLTRTDLARNIDRFYVVAIMPSLFGDWTVLREWGRLSAQIHFERRNASRFF